MIAAAAGAAVAWGALTTRAVATVECAMGAAAAEIAATEAAVALVVDTCD